jgi:hypothetical protein
MVILPTPTSLGSIAMTTITNNASGFPATVRDRATLGAEFVVAAGILGRALNPLGASPRAFGQLPSFWAVTALSASIPQPQASWTASTGANGQASIDLGDGYTLQLNENASEISIANANSGETTRIWGDPHVEVNGHHVFDFAGTTTFTLDNGTKITINTEQYAANPDAYVASKVTITKGDQAIVVDGISQNQRGDLAISMSRNGRLIDAMTRDGFVLEENASGTGWNSGLTGRVATQADLNATMPGQLYGPGSSMPSLGELASLFTSFLTFGILIDLAGEATRGHTHAVERAAVQVLAHAVGA